MYAAAWMLSASPSTASLGLPYFHLGQLGPIQWFGLIVAAGVLIGAAILRRYAEWHGVSDDHIRGLTGWITLTGFIGAHVFDVIAYQGDKPWFEFTGVWFTKWPLMLQLWAGISSYGGFVGGAMGFAFYVWWKRLPARLMADIAIVGLLPAFSIGRIGCTVVSDHIGGAVDPSAWYSFLAMDYPRTLNMEVVQNLVAAHPGTGPMTAWNLGLIELLYLIPVNALILWLAFRPKKRMPAGLLIALTGVLYAPVRFFLDYLRPENSDPRHFGFTFAQWCSFAAFGAAAYLVARLLKHAEPAAVVAPTSGEAQAALRVMLKDVVEEESKSKAKGGDKPGAKADKAKASEPAKPVKTEPDPIAEAKRLKEEADEREAAERRKKQDEELEAKKAAAAAAAKADDASDAEAEPSADKAAPASGKKKSKKS